MNAAELSVFQGCTDLVLTNQNHLTTVAGFAECGESRGKGGVELCTAVQFSVDAGHFLSAGRDLQSDLQ